MEPAEGLQLFLMGRPRAMRDGVERAVRGRKPWGLIAYLLRTRVPQSREHLAELFFSQADDPLGALRWNLAEIRRCFGLPNAFASKDISFDLPADTFVDVEVLDSGDRREAMALPTLGSEFLDGLVLADCSSFETWLLTERRYLTARAQSVLRDGVLALLAKGDAEAAVAVASRLVALDPLEDGSQELMIRALASSGDADSAKRQLSACVSLFKRELGVEPSPAVRSAALAKPPEGVSESSASAPAALLEAAGAALDAGATESGITTLRQAIVIAKRGGDSNAEMRGLLLLGTALVHSVRGADEEGSIYLSRALLLADEVGSEIEAIEALNELAYVDFLRGDYERSDSLVQKALERGPPSSQRAHALIILGAGRTEVAHYPESLHALELAVDSARDAGDHKRLSFCFSWVARLHLLRGQFEQAITFARRSLDLANAERWTAFLPWPEVIMAEAHYRAGDIERARSTLDHAYPLACHLQDPCWEAMTMRLQALLLADDGDDDGAVALCLRAVARGSESSDSYRWTHAYCLDGLCQIAVRSAHPKTVEWAKQLELISGRHGMQELLVRSRVYSGRGERDALESALLLAQGIDNPNLHAWLREMMTPVDPLR